VHSCTARADRGELGGMGNDRRTMVGESES
jgi:hypothetical protein